MEKGATRVRYVPDELVLHERFLVGPLASSALHDVFSARQTDSSADPSVFERVYFERRKRTKKKKKEKEGKKIRRLPTIIVEQPWAGSWTDSVRHFFFSFFIFFIQHLVRVISRSSGPPGPRKVPRVPTSSKNQHQWSVQRCTMVYQDGTVAFLSLFLSFLFSSIFSFFATLVSLISGEKILSRVSEEQKRRRNVNECWRMSRRRCCVRGIYLDLKIRSSSLCLGSLEARRRLGYFTVR